MGLLDEAKPTPRKNKTAGLLADVVEAIDTFARKPFGYDNPPVQKASDFLGVPGFYRTLDRVSYGEPLTTGSGWATKIRPDTVDALGFVPMAPKTAALGLLGGVDTGAAKAIFAGVNAKTADKAALATAEKMTSAGADPRAIWKETGWMKGGDGKWRFEIDDSKARLRDYNYTPQEAFNNAMRNAVVGDASHERALSMRPYADKTKAQLVDEYATTGEKIVDAALSGDKAAAAQMLADRSGLDAMFSAMRDRTYGPVSSYLKHGELGAAYPDAYKMHTLITSDVSPSLGQYMRGDHTMGEQVRFAQKPLMDDGKSIMLHELQHAVQQREGFAKGGSPNQFTRPDADAMKVSRQMAELSMVLEEADKYGLNFMEYATNPPRWLSPESVGHLKRWGYDRSILEGNIQDFKNAGLQPDEKYRRLAGEAEARAVQKRMNLTPDQRRATFPLDSYDVPIDQLIYR